MSCTGDSILEGLRFPSRRKASPNLGEELFTIAEDFFGAERDRLLNLGWAADLKGDKKSLLYYKGANIYNYLTHLLIIYYNKLYSQGYINSCDDEAKKVFANIDCIYISLECLSIKYNSPYIKLFKAALDSLELTPTDCSCCKGIGKLVIEGDDCEGFIIGACSDEQENCTMIGFKNGEFPCEEFA